MKNFSSIKIYKLILDFTWYSILVIVSLWALINVVSIAFDGVVRVGDMFTINIEATSVDDNPFKISDNFNFSVEKQPITEISIINFKVGQFGTSFILFYIFSALTAFALALWQLKLLREFLKNIIDKNIFSKENVAKLTTIAFIELATIPLSISYYFFMATIFKNTNVLNANYVFVTDYFGSFEPLVHALEYFVFAGVFAFGLKLKEEQDLTI